ncbi:MAG: hypothetical protein Q8P93_03560 [bacterium]|nr:hypothetical protein [bacterium]
MEEIMMRIADRDYSKLNLGCGRDITKKLPAPWLNVDVEGSAADVVYDIRSLPQGWTKAFDEVRVSHVLEHFFLDEMPSLLTEWHRVLVSHGQVRIIVPDLKIIATALLSGTDSKRRRSVSVTDTTAVLAQIYGVGYETSRTQNEWRHRFLFDEELLKELLNQNGFKNAERYDPNEDPAKTYGVNDDSQNPFSLCVIAQKSKGENR